MSGGKNVPRELVTLCLRGWSGNLRSGPPTLPITLRSDALSHHGYTPEQLEKLAHIHSRLIEARRELDALIGDAYLRPRASIVPVHFLDLASAVEKLRWAEKEWRELDQQVAAEHATDDETEEAEEADPELVDVRRG